MSYGSETRPLLAYVSVPIFRRTILGYYAEGMNAILKKIRPKYSQWRSFNESKPITCTNSFREKLLASCMTNLSEFHIVFSSSALIRLRRALVPSR